MTPGLRVEVEIDPQGLSQPQPITLLSCPPTQEFTEKGLHNLESWVKKNPDSTEAWALPACNFTGNLELTLGGAMTREAGRTQTTDVVMQGKTLFKTLELAGV
jgi:hypothetical protein